MDELISRQAMKNMITNHWSDFSNAANYRTALACVDAVPTVTPAQPEPKRGKWIEDRGQQILMQNFIAKGEVWRVCSVCGAGHMIGHKYASDKAYHDTHHNFCPNCGADMRGVTT